MEVTVIIPVHELNETTSKCLSNAINSYNEAKNDNTKLMVVTTESVKNDISGKYDCEIITVENGESTSFQHLVNVGVKKCDTEYFLVLEYDDVLRKNIFTSAEKYMKSGYEASVYMSLTEAIDFNSGEAFGYINEAVLSSSFSEEMNYLDKDCIIDYLDANYTGSIFNKKDYEEVGGLKESMKLYFWHEFAMRAIHNEKRFFVVPKVGYLHTVNRLNSFYDTCGKTMSSAECDWWLDLAGKEYFFKKDRNKTFEE